MDDKVKRHGSYVLAAFTVINFQILGHKKSFFGLWDQCQSAVNGEITG